MRTFIFILVLSLILLIYSSANYYVLRRALQSFPFNPTAKVIFIILFILLAYSYIIGRFLEKPLNSDFTYYFIWFGSFWLAAILYFFLLVLFIDILRLSNHWFHWFPDFILNNWNKVKIYTLLSSIFIVFTILLSGYLNNFFPKIVNLKLTVPKRESSLANLKIVMASDIHLGTSITKKQIANLVDEINKQKPDLILLAGDILDEDPQYLIKHQLGSPLKKLSSKYGVWGITGNHEYIGGISPALEYISSLNINILRDKIELIDNAFYLAGRDDYSKKSFTKQKRMELNELFQGHNNNLPLIMMDHQPFKLKEAANYPIDLQLSGHTHHGQLFPFQLITKAIYEISMGYGKIKNTHLYVSGGYGIWGPPIRTVSRPEIIIINLKFE